MTRQAIPEQVREAPLEHVDGRLLKALFEAAGAWLEQHVHAINALNVFPVPDGDTGTNMMLTMRSALKAIADAGDSGAGEVLARVAHGALMGARGNSGVILSQLLRGLADSVQGKERITARDLAEGFRVAVDSAYKAVMKPVEGTILTVAREVARAAQQAAGRDPDVMAQLAHMVEVAREALQRTPEQLPVLKEAGVVDSGAKGLVVILEGMLRHLRGEEVGTLAADVAHVDVEALLDAPPEPLADGRYGYDIQFLIRGENLDVGAIREYMNSIGDCALVIGDSHLVKVHVHCLNPGPALEYGANLGMLDDIVVENMDLQYEAFRSQHQAAHPPVVEKGFRMEEITGVGTVAVVLGDGFRQVFESLGVSAIVTGGQTMNPSTQEILEAIQAVQAEAVIVLPNNKNIVLAARQAAELADRPVYVVPTTSLPQGIAALMAFNFSADVEANVKSMTRAIEHVISGEVTQAVRATHLDGVEVRQGDIIGLLDGRLVAAGSDHLAVIRDMLARVDLGRHELCTLYYGADVSAAEAEALAQALRDAFPSLEFEVVEGGQPHYHYIFSVE